LDIIQERGVEQEKHIVSFIVLFVLQFLHLHTPALVFGVVGELIGELVGYDDTGFGGMVGVVKNDFV